MANLRSSAFQSFLRTRNYFIWPKQRRWAQVHDVRFLATHYNPNQVMDRYRNKLDQKAKAEGHQDVDTLKDAYKDKIDDLRRKASTPLTPEATPSPSPSPSNSPTPPPSPAQEQAKAATEASKSGIKPLGSYIDLEKTLALPAKEIEAIWRLRHANNPHSICACIPVETYQRIAEAARQNPQFVLPLPRKQSESQSQEIRDEANSSGNDGAGADIHFLQWGFHPPATAASSPVPAGPLASSHTSTIIFTHLAAFQTHGSYAQPHTTITHHLDLADEKGIVLMLGQVMPDSGISTTEATFLASCVQRFYDFGGQAHGRKGELLRMFTKGDAQNFKIEHLLEEAEKL
ncbi:ATP11 family protein [Aspergillus affinis]|uniref:ATP11 family protein n=1 Tax=Aspergillus affinis TaxID=1070780 RepID=UPI0022FEDD69|nr:ATP11-domain-containing protein [Aspergillus affinis]KAI9042300.1 ATP11-domain-containing protein [Aspergillus affinis]